MKDWEAPATPQAVTYRKPTKSRDDQYRILVSSTSSISINNDTISCTAPNDHLLFDGSFSNV